jgi:hypothetical protein
VRLADKPMSTEFALQVVVIFPKILGIRVERNLIVFDCLPAPGDAR